MKLSTLAIHAGLSHHGQEGAVSVPIYQTSTFAFPTAGEGAARFAGSDTGYIYTRLGNPTVNALEETVAALEGGARGMATASGMAAITTVFLALLERGAHIVSTDGVYGPTRIVLETTLAKFGVEATFVDTSDAGAVAAALRPSTRIVFLETPSNPTMTLSDIRAIADLVRDTSTTLVVDNTFASPVLQRPLELGADIVIHSLTKYLNGHSDVIGGMIITREESMYRTVRPVLNQFGGTMDPHQAWLVLRGIRTLPLRVEKAQQNAIRVAEFLTTHPMVTWVRFPGLPDHPQHELACRQMDGFGSMIAFGVRGGLPAGETLMNSVRLFTLAVSLGGVESLIEHPASMTHASVPRADREKAGITDDLVRVAVGCEDADDLCADLEEAFSALSRAAAPSAGKSPSVDRHVGTPGRAGR